MSLEDDIRRGMTVLRKEMTSIGGADSRETQAAGRVLASSIRKVISVPAPLVAGPHRKANARPRALRAAKGAAPRMVSRKLRKSIGLEVVGGVLRAGSSRFTSRLLENNGHPFMEQALENALPKMEGEFVGELQKRGDLS
jgi:hypothetical protein